MNIEREYLVENSNIVEFIKNKYGLFDLDNFIKFFKNDFYYNRINLNDESIKKILIEIDKLLEFQKLSYTDLVFIGCGQSFGVIQVGEAVVKIGKPVEYGDEVYRLSPVHEVPLESNVTLYVSQRANGKVANEDDVLNFYQMIKDEGSIWLDPKENNLGYVDHFLNFKKLYNIDLDNLNYPGPFLLDYEDIITMDEENKRDLLNWYGSEEDINYLSTEKDKWSFYYNLFVRKRYQLLEIEKKIAIKKGDFDYAYRIEIQEEKNSEGKINYYDDNYYTYDYVNYPMSSNLERQERKYKVTSSFKKFFKKDETKKHR